ncbi:MAG: zinc-dependent alcohol dehydrogenase family protein [Elusimicrobiota bacterium]
MRAWILRHPGPLARGPLRLVTLPRPSPRPGQVRIRVQACGLCHTDLHIIEGDLPPRRRRIVCGHQVVGVVDAVGRGVRRPRVGERVGVPWLHSVCGRCADCRRGDENLCARARFTGYHVHGGYAEYMIASRDAAYRIPAAYPAAEAAPLLCAGVIGYRALRTALAGASGRGYRLGLYGFGASAHVTLQIARQLGCVVHAFSRSPGHRRLARRLGAVWAKSADDSPPEPLDGSIMFAPAGPLVPKAMPHLRKGGTLALAGITMTPIPSMPYSLLYWERRLVSVANSTRADVRDFLALAGRRRLRMEIERVPFEEAPAALARLKEGAVQGAAVLEM